MPPANRLRSKDESIARQVLVRALWDLRRYGQGTYGERECIEVRIPNAVEKMIEAALEARASSPTSESQQGNQKEST